MEQAFESGIHVPPGWPDPVRPPGAPDWERTATEYLLDCCPAEYRLHPLLRRHPVVLAAFARRHVDGQLETGIAGLAEVRVRIGDQVSPEVVQRAVEVWQQEVARLRRRRRAVGLVEEALRGARFVPRL